MRIKILFLLFIISSSTPVFSCLNEYRVTLNGSIIEMNTLYPHFGYEEQRIWRDRKSMLRNADSIYRLSGRLEDYSDYGVALVRDGQYEKAKNVFIEIEKQSPGLYNTSANLGTTYELLGKNDSALVWIKKAVAIDPHSHQDSEWIHVKILEAKNKSIPDLYHYNILSLDFGDSKVPENVNNVNLAALDSQLTYQLEERVFFVKPKDGVMGQLFFQLGNIRSFHYTLKDAVEMYELAKKYGYTDDVMDARIDLFNDLQEQAEDQQEMGFVWFMYLFLLGVPVFIFGIVLLVKRYERKQMK